MSSRLLIVSFSVCPAPDRHGVQLVNVLKALAPRYTVDVLTLRAGTMPFQERFMKTRMLRVPVVGTCCGGRAFDCSGITYRSANRIHKRCRQQTAQCRTKPRGEFIHAKCAVARNHYPVEQGWLLKPWHSTEGGRDPIASRKHLARDFGVARLVGTNERERPKSPKIKSADEDKE